MYARIFNTEACGKNLQAIEPSVIDLMGLKGKGSSTNRILMIFNERFIYIIEPSAACEAHCNCNKKWYAFCITFNPSSTILVTAIV